jgi:TonB family protein
MTLLVGLSVGGAVGQKAGSAAETAAAPEKIYDGGPDLVAPQLIPVERAIPNADACENESDNSVALSLIVDADGKPRDVTVVNPKGTAVERLAQRILEQDSFKPGTRKGQPVEVRLKALVTIAGCIATKKNADGSSSKVFRLKAQPVQAFAERLEAEEDRPANASVRQQRDGLADTAGLYKIGGGVSPPVPLNFVEAEFSDEARRKNIEGVCLVTLIVDIHGNPQNLRIVRGLGYGLDEKALEAVRKYHFKPAMKDKVPVPVMITVEVNFRL